MSVLVLTDGACSYGYYATYITECDPSTTTPTGTPGSTWTTVIKNNQAIYKRSDGLETEGVLIGPFSSAYHYLVWSGDAIVSFNTTPVNLFQYIYESSRVTFQESTLELTTGGSIWGYDISDNFYLEINYSSLDGWVCYGVTETLGSNTLDTAGFPANGIGYCVESNGGSVNSYGVTLGCEICNQCHDYCAACEGGSNTQCTSCNFGYYLQPYSTTCSSDCLDPYYADSITNKCIYCDAACTACSGTSYSQCYECNTGYYLQPASTICLENCPAGYFANASANVCTSNRFYYCHYKTYYFKSNQIGCYSSCYTCEGPDPDNCLSCTVSKFLYQSMCSSSCPSIGYFPNNDTNRCQQCDSTCATCSGPLETDCMSCPSSRYFYQSTCVTECPAGTYLDINNSSCVACDSPCYTCDGEGNANCTGCNGTLYLYESTCIECLNQSYYADPSDNICKPCDPTCHSCNGTQPDNCVSCNGSLHLYQSSCVEECPTIGYYKHTGSNVCEQCHSSCHTCSWGNSTDCLSCPTGTYLMRTNVTSGIGVCEATCPDGYYPNNYTGLCTKCHSSCKTCTAGNSTSCTSCNASLLLFSTATNSCVTTCPSGTWLNNLTRTCLPCNSSCATCLDAVKCTKCASSHGFFYNQVCYENFCPDGTYRNVSSMTCKVCPTGCLLCGSPILCLGCASGYSLYTNPLTQDSICVKTCPSSYYSGYVATTHSYICQKCDSSCVECNGPNSNQCTDCPDGQTLSRGSCVTPTSDFSCPSGTYLDSFQCLNCSKGCASCSEVTRCNECKAGYALGTTTGLCEIPQSSCHSSCKACSGATEYDCTSCTTPLVLHGGMCVKSCSQGFKLNVMTNKCEICLEGCTSCIPELFYFGGNCLFSCPTGTTAVIDEKGQVSCNLEEGAPIISFSQQPSQTTPVGLNQDILIQVSVIYPSSSSSQTKAINWKQTDIKAPKTKLLQGITSLNTALLVIPKKNLIADTKYELTVEVLLDGAVATSAITSFTTTKSIIGGNFDITPSRGSFYDTTFTLTLSGWAPNIVNGLALTFSIAAYRNDNSNNKRNIAQSLDLLSSLSSGGYQFTIPSLFESQNENDVVYRIELLAESSSDLLTVSKTIILQPLSSNRVAELIANTDPATIKEPVAMSNFAVLTAKNLIQSNSLETETTKAMLTAFQTYQTLTGDYSVTCIDSIHCSGHGTCFFTAGSTSSTGYQCACHQGWSGSACNKDSLQLQQAQQKLEVALTGLLSTPPTTSTVGSQLLAIQTTAKEPDLIATSITMPSLMSKTLISGYKVISSSSESTKASSRSILSAVADAACSLLAIFSNALDSNNDIEQLAQIFAGSLQDLLSGLGSGESTEIDTALLYVFMETVDSLFDEVFDDEESDDRRRILQSSQQQPPQRQSPRVLTSTSTSSISDAKKKAALQNKVSTQTPFKSASTIDITKLKQVLSALLSQLKQGKTVKMKTETQYNTASGDFQIPQLTLKVSSQVKFSIQETKTDKNTQASNSNSLVTKSVTFSAYDGSKELSISDLQTPIRMSIPKTTPTTPSSSGSMMYQCSYYDETSRRFLTNGCSFIGENLTHIICQCNHATEFAVQINEAALNAFDSIFNKPSLQELLSLSVQRISNKDQAFKLELQKNILARTQTAIYEYRIARFSFLPIGVSLLIFLILFALYPIVNFFLDVKQGYFASWSDEFVHITNESEGTKRLLTNARVFWSFYSLFASRTQKHFSAYGAKTFTFYAEIINLMGNVLAWTIFVNSLKGMTLFPQDKSPIPAYLFVIGASYLTATVSFYATIGSLNFCRIRFLREHYLRAEARQLSSTTKLAGWEFFYTVFCILVILAWLALFAALSTVLMNAEMNYWLGCCLGAVLFSYLIIDALMVALYRKFRPKVMLLTLAMRALNSEYISLSLHKKE